MAIDKETLLLKVAAMFRPSSSDFLDHKADNVICGPNDRAMVGFDTYFPKDELIQDFGFTQEEADFFFATVKEIAPLTQS